jgi:oligopeptide transport system permease protein
LKPPRSSIRAPRWAWLPQRLSLRLALVLLLLLGLAALAAPWLPIADPAAVHLEQRMQAPAWFEAPILGTDSKGRDLLARTLWGARISLMIGFLGSLVALAIGLPYGAIAGMVGGRTDRFLMRLADFLEGIPMAVVILFLLSVLQEYRVEFAAMGLGRMHLFMLAVGCLFWLPTARIARAEALRLRKTSFVEAAQLTGASARWILWRHFLPNLMPSALVMMGITLPRVILMEAFLSFLGLGVEAPDVSWGILASEGLATLNPLIEGAWLLAVPASALCLTLLCMNLLADAWADRLAQRTQRHR